MSYRRPESAGVTAARFVRLREARRAPESKPLPYSQRGRRLPPVVTVLHQILVDGEYRYRETETGSVYTAAEARALTGPRVVRYIDGRPRVS